MINKKIVNEVVFYTFYDCMDGVFKIDSISKKLVAEFTPNLNLLNIKEGLIIDKNRCFTNLEDAVNSLKKDRINNFIITGGTIYE